MKILIVSFYFEPDLSAGSFRTSAFVKALKGRISPGDSIDVVTTMPNRYNSFRVDVPDIQRDGNVTIKRIRVPSHKSGFMDQALSYCAYCINSWRFARRGRYDVVFATSSRLFSAWLGAVISWRKKIPLYLDIRDIFVDTLRSVLKRSKMRYAIPVFLLFERFTIRRADKVNLVSKGFASYFQRKYRKDYSFFTNGIDDDFLHCNFEEPSSSHLPGGKTIITYSGNVGEGQGLERIVPGIAERYKDIEFRVIGDGGRIRALEESVSGMPNVRLFAPVSRKKLIDYYSESDFLFLHLNNYEAFKKVLPSKIFEYGAMFKPIIAGVDGYAREFIGEHLPDTMIFRPCDIDDFCGKYEKYSGVVDLEARKRFIAKFSRRNIMDEMAADFLEMCLTKAGSKR